MQLKGRLGNDDQYCNIVHVHSTVPCYISDIGFRYRCRYLTSVPYVIQSHTIQIPEVSLLINRQYAKVAASAHFPDLHPTAVDFTPPAVVNLCCTIMPSFDHRALPT